MSRDRRDAKVVRNIDAMHKVMIDIKPNRCDEDVYIHEVVDVTNLVKYMKKKKKEDDKITYFHFFSSAIAKTICHRPLLNRYVKNGDFYDRNDITLAFVAKTTFEDHSEELMAKINVDKNDNLNSIKDKISNKVGKIRKSKKNDTDSAIDIVGKLPKWLRKLVVKVFIFLDNHDMVPESITSNLIYYSTVILSNLGSIHCNAIYHNLTDFGTNSILLTIGEIKKENYLDDDGKLQQRYMCDFGINLDERIADGFYFAKSFQLFKEYLQKPEVLEEKFDK